MMRTVLMIIFAFSACAPMKTDSSGTDGSSFVETRKDAGIVDGGGINVTEPFRLLSSAFQDEGVLPAEFTCDGAGNSPPLHWTGVPSGTIEFALVMTTLAKDGQKWNWVLYHLAPSVLDLPKGVTGLGINGLTSDGPNLAYAPPCSQGPGAKKYSFTIYALSKSPSLPVNAKDVNGAVLTQAISEITLSTSTIDVSYTRL